MIDIHCHILPMVDDGSNSVEMSLQMLDSAYRHGTDSIILTPHLAYSYGFDNPTSKIEELFEQFKQIVEYEGIPIDLYLGCEYLYTTKESFHRHFQEITLLNDTDYLLMEFFFDVDASTILEAIREVKKKGYNPIIAHPERFEAIQEDEELPERMVKMGAKLQMNKASILGNHGRRAFETVLSLLERRLISFVGSDAHHPIHRDSKMDEAFQIVVEYFGEKYARKIFSKNPRKYLIPESIEEVEEEIEFTYHHDDEEEDFSDLFE